VHYRFFSSWPWPSEVAITDLFWIMHTGILIHFTASLFLSLFIYRPSRSLPNHPRPTVRLNSIQPGNVHIYGCLLIFNKWYIPQKCTRTSSLMYLFILLLSVANIFLKRFNLITFLSTMKKPFCLQVLIEIIICLL